MFLKMKVAGLTFDPVLGMPIVILKDLNDNNAIPIWIGIFEATAIASQIENIKPPRPITHDLMCNMLKTLGTEIVKIEVSELKNDTFYALIHLLTKDGKTHLVDSRPSDAIALALRTNSPIYVAQEVIDKSRKIELREEKKIDFSQKSKEKWAEILESLSPEDFGKYKM